MTHAVRRNRVFLAILAVSLAVGVVVLVADVFGEWQYMTNVGEGWVVDPRFPARRCPPGAARSIDCISDAMWEQDFGLAALPSYFHLEPALSAAVATFVILAILAIVAKVLREDRRAT